MGSFLYLSEQTVNFHVINHGLLDKGAKTHGECVADSSCLPGGTTSADTDVKVNQSNHLIETRQFTKQIPLLMLSESKVVTFLTNRFRIRKDFSRNHLML